MHNFSLLVTLSILCEDRKSAVEGKRVDLGGRRIIKKKKQHHRDDAAHLAIYTIPFLLS